MSGFIYKFINRFRRFYHLNFTAARIKQQSAATPGKGEYIDRPRVSAVVQLFNKRKNIAAIVAALMTPAIEEIIILEDGSSDGALEVLPSLLTGKNHFIIRSNDLFEVRTYSRALDFARGEFVALLQDDDLPPADGEWITEAVELFERHPKLAILGGRDGIALKFKEGTPSRDTLTYEMSNHVNGKRVVMPFTFVETVNRAPVLLRREAIQRLGGIDTVFAPFQYDDVDLSLRAWKAGLQVGLYSTDFMRDVGMGGMRLYNEERIITQAPKNWQVIFDRYGKDIEAGYFRDAVTEARKIENPHV